MTRALALALMLVAWLLPALAQGQASDLWRRGQRAERAGEPGEALEAYRALVAADPSGRLANRARRRLEFLQSRTERGVEPLARLLEAQNAPTRTHISALERDAASFDEPRVRREAWSLVGATWLSFDEPSRAAAAYRALLEDPGLTAPQAERARAGLARALAAAGDPAAAMRVLREAGDEGALLDQLNLEQRSKTGVAVALAVLGLFLVGLAWRTRLHLFGGLETRQVALAAWVLGVPLALATGYDAEAFDTFAWLAVSSAPVLLGARALGRHAASRRERWLAAAGAVAAQAAVAYLVLVERGAVLGVGP